MHGLLDSHVILAFAECFRCCTQRGQRRILASGRGNPNQRLDYVARQALCACRQLLLGFTFRPALVITAVTASIAIFALIATTAP